jgi:hypothetical protein
LPGKARLKDKRDSREEAFGAKQQNQFRDAENVTIYQTVILARNQ